MYTGNYFKTGHRDKLAKQNFHAVIDKMNFLFQNPDFKSLFERERGSKTSADRMDNQKLCLAMKNKIFDLNFSFSPRFRTVEIPQVSYYKLGTRNLKN